MLNKQFQKLFLIFYWNLLFDFIIPFFKMRFVNLVSTNPGLMLFTRIFLDARSKAVDLVNPLIPNLLDE